MKRVLITGIDGFIGHHLAEGILKNTDWKIVGLSKIDCASTLHRLIDIEKWLEKYKERVEFVYHDLRAPLNPYLVNRIGPVNYIFHLAANTHVDRSITDPLEFVQDNVVGTANLLEYARSLEALDLFLYFSTDEIFGPANDGQAFKEWDRYRSSNPYAATKAAGEELTYSYYNTYGLPAAITHTMNVFGERQHPEKYIPKVINAVLHDEKIFVHSYPGSDRPGSRHYVHARNVASAVQFIVDKHEKDDSIIGDKFNIAGEEEVDNLQIALSIAEIIGKELKYELVDFQATRPGHDLRYSLDGTKLKEMGFEFPKTFSESLEKTVKWYLDNPEWLLDEFSKSQFQKEQSAVDDQAARESARKAALRVKEQTAALHKDT